MKSIRFFPKFLVRRLAPSATINIIDEWCHDVYWSKRIYIQENQILFLSYRQCHAVYKSFHRTKVLKVNGDKQIMQNHLLVKPIIDNSKLDQLSVSLKAWYLPLTIKNVQNLLKLKIAELGMFWLFVSLELNIKTQNSWLI